MISHCIHSSDLASLGKACHWSPCPPAVLKSMFPLSNRGPHTHTRARARTCARTHTRTHARMHARRAPFPLRPYVAYSNIKRCFPTQPQWYSRPSLSFSSGSEGSWCDLPSRVVLLAISMVFWTQEARTHFPGTWEILSDRFSSGQFQRRGLSLCPFLLCGV